MKKQLFNQLIKGLKAMKRHLADNSVSGAPTTNLETKRNGMKSGHRTSVLLRQQSKIKRFRGKLDWQGGLDAMRTDK